MPSRVRGGEIQMELFGNGSLTTPETAVSRRGSPAIYHNRGRDARGQRAAVGRSDPARMKALTDIA